MRTLILTVTLAAAAGAAQPFTQATNWFQWGGPYRDRKSGETGLLKSWPAQGPPVAWRATGAGIGYSSFAASHGRIYTLGGRANREYVIAFDAGTGKKVWETPIGTLFSNDRGDGPRDVIAFTVPSPASPEIPSTSIAGIHPRSPRRRDRCFEGSAPHGRTSPRPVTYST